MKAITVTQELKDLNPSIKNSVGSVVELKSVPKSFYSLTYNNGDRTDGYHLLPVSVHEADGFYDIVEPLYDNTTHKQGGVIWDSTNSVFTREVTPLSLGEIESNNERALQIDNASVFFGNRKFFGNDFIDKFNAFVYRKVVNAEITKTQAIITLSFFYEALTPLTFGYLEEARDRVTALTTGNAQLIVIRDKIVSDIQKLIDDE